MSEQGNTFHFLEISAGQYANVPAVISGENSVSFGILHDRAMSWKASLLKAGVQKGQVVGMLFENSPEFVMALFAVMATGAVVLPVYPSLKKGERQTLYEDTQMRFLLAADALIRHETEEWKLSDRWEGLSLMGRNPANDDGLKHVKDAACIRFSSGTTGLHKGVVLSHRSVDERTAAVIKVLDLHAGDRVLWVLPMAFHYIATVIAFVRYGITLVISPAIFAKELIRTANRENATMFYASPMHIRLLASAEGRERFLTVKKVVTTSSGIDKDSCARFTNRMGLVPQQAFGIIEVGVPIINAEATPETADRLGKAVQPYEAAILDEEGRDVQAGIVGSLAVRGPGMFEGYIKPPESREKILKNGWFITGDRGVRFIDGSLAIRGREKSVINVSGNKVFPEEVEFILEEMAEISEALVYGSFHALTGEFPVAHVVLKKGMTLGEDVVLKRLHEKLTAFKVPRKIHFVDDIGKTATGKKKRTG